MRHSICKIENVSSTFNTKLGNNHVGEGVRDRTLARLKRRGHNTHLGEGLSDGRLRKVMKKLNPNTNSGENNIRELSICKFENNHLGNDGVHDKTLATFNNYLGNEPIDEDYMWYVDYLSEKGELWVSRREEDDYDDPQYNLFLQNLREDGASYILDVPGKSGVFVKYEERSGSNKELASKEVAQWTKPHDEPTRNAMALSLPRGGFHVPKGCSIDKCYELFLECVEQEGDLVVFVTKDGKRVTYEDDDESSDLEILALDNAPFCNALVPCDYFDSSMEGEDLRCLGNANERSNSVFREKLIATLERPYDQMEYERLFEAVKERKPVTGYRDLRGGLVPYSAVKFNSSYLDNHPALQKRIDAARLDRRKVLNILRGFFFWLENLAHEGAFYPWFDSLSLAVLPKNG